MVSVNKDFIITYYYPCLVKYIGYIKDKKYDGYGKLYYNNGMIHYEGDFKKQMFNGYGIKYNEEGSILHNGLFYNGFPVFI